MFIDRHIHPDFRRKMVEPNFDDSLDIEMFIEEVQKYPEIWNAASEDYHDRTKKRNAWMNICYVFCEGFHDKDERDKSEILYPPDFAPCDYFLLPNLEKLLGNKKFESNEEIITETNAYFESLENTYYLEGLKKLRKRSTKYIELEGTKLIKKWRNIKDNFLKSIKKKVKSGRAPDTGRRYIYARHLSFLQQAYSTDAHTTWDEEQSLDRSELEVELVETGSSWSPPAEPQNTKKRKRDLESILTDFTKALNATHSLSTLSETNEDRLFFESLLPTLSEFTTDQKLEFRSEVLDVIRRMRKQEITVKTETSG